MLKQYKSKDQKGFTIIEVLIVLAIAGLILLIVFLAVPALQRNSRNTQRKTDVGRVGGAATTVVSNNQGKIDATFDATKVQTEVGDNLSYYQSSAISVDVLTTAGAKSTNDASVDKVKVVGNGKCDSAKPGDAVFANRQIAVLWSSEKGDGSANVLCVDQ